jgi:ADP-heptose:LPS heptosyltransferase
VNVLVLQRRRVGDILMTTPALRALKARFSQAEVTYVCERPFSQVLRLNEHVDTLLPCDADVSLKQQLRLLATLRGRKFDLALDFEGSSFSALLVAGSGAARRIGFRSALGGHAYTDRVAASKARDGYMAADKLALLAPLGIEVRSLGLRPTLRVEPRAGDWAGRTLEAAGVGSSDFLVTLGLSARAPELRWPAERYARLLDALATSHAFEVILILAPGDEALGGKLAGLTGVPLFQLSTAPSLGQIAALLDRADLHIGNENAARHMAAALGTATLALFAPGERRRWTMSGDPLQAGVEPAPQPEGWGAAPPIAGISAEEAYAALLKLEGYLPRLRAVRRASTRGVEPGADPGAPRHHDGERLAGPTPRPHHPAGPPHGTTAHSGGA